MPTIRASQKIDASRLMPASEATTASAGPNPPSVPPPPSPFGVSPTLICSLPPMAAGLDLNARQFYGVGGNLPQQRILPPPASTRTDSSSTVVEKTTTVIVRGGGGGAAPAPVGGPVFVYNETPAVVSPTVHNLAAAPSPAGSLVLVKEFVGGMRGPLLQPDDYVVVGNQITLAVGLAAGEALRALEYRTS